MDNPELYNQNNQPQQSGVQKYLTFYGEKLRTQFNGKEVDLLDIGSGCGRVLSEIIIVKSGLKFSKIIGIDVSEEMVKFSNTKYGSDLISFHVMDAEGEVPEILKNQQFDIVTSFYCLPYCKNLNAAIQNIQKFLKPNGLFCCIFSQLPKSINENELVSSNDKHAKYMFKYRDLPNARVPDDVIGVIARHLNANGMESIEVTDIENDGFEFANVEAARRLIEAVIPKLKNMSLSEKQEVIDKQFKMSEINQIGDKVVFALRNLYFIARKL
ncbi:hypothetical protein ACKWTF_013255 [Chironomus riparius]